MSTAIGESLTAIGGVPQQEPPFYVINLYTWLSDQQAAADLAIRIASLVRSYPDIDDLATTISEEGDPQAELAKVFIDFIRHPDEDIEKTLAAAFGYIEESR